MPIFEYRCRHCHHCFEVLIRNAMEESELKCPHCDGGDPERMLSLFARTCSSKESLSSTCGPTSGGFS
ncbi:MAG: zinc ribbon domain-containing protein [Syntrophobacteraceae bacterium]|jgi:putative FmdB family regulatory protein|nr:zinc ribbon domain-containing protein [Syntrophobacteraceae bacterium]